jgi:hypothetical protein
MIRLLRTVLLAMAAAPGFCGLSASASEAAAATGGLPPLASFSEVIDRPLFAPDRKRHIKAEPPAAAGKPVLTAIIMLKNKRYAVLREGNAPARRVNEGDSIQGLTVKKILRDRIVIVATDGAETTLRLFPDPPADAAKSETQPVASPPAPVVTAGMPDGPPPGLAPVDNRPRKPLITSNR